MPLLRSLAKWILSLKPPLGLRVFAKRWGSKLRKGPKLPTALVELVQAGLWATEGHDDKRIPSAVTKTWDPGSYGICLQNPVPMWSVVDGSGFWDDYGCLEGVDLGAQVLIWWFSGSLVGVILRGSSAFWFSEYSSQQDYPRRSMCSRMMVS